MGRAADLRVLASLIPARTRLVVGAAAGEPGDAPVEEAVVPTGAVRPGDLVRVLPGERFPVDGTIDSGACSSDESLVTGESRLIPKHEGDQVRFLIRMKPELDSFSSFSPCLLFAVLHNLLSSILLVEPVYFFFPIPLPPHIVSSLSRPYLCGMLVFSPLCFSTPCVSCRCRWVRIPCPTTVPPLSKGWFCS